MSYEERWSDWLACISEESSADPLTQFRETAGASEEWFPKMYADSIFPATVT